MTDKTYDIPDYLRVAWKRKWRILLPALACTIAAGAASYVLPRKWEVSCLIRPGKILLQTSGGTYQEFTVGDPRQIAEAINQDAYRESIALEMGLDARGVPRVAAENPRNTSLIKVSLRTADPERGKAILTSLFNLVKKGFDRETETERQSQETLIANNRSAVSRLELDIKDRTNEISKTKNDLHRRELEIKAKEVGKAAAGQEIESLQALGKVSQSRAQAIQEDTARARERIKDIEKRRDEVKAGDPNSALTLLLYANEIQENVRYADTLGRELNEEFVKQENLRLEARRKEEDVRILDIGIETDRTEMRNLQAQIKDLENEIEKVRNAIQRVENENGLLQARMSRYSATQFIKNPTPSAYPVSPRRGLIVLLAAVLGLSLFTLLAFFQEYVGGETPAGKKE